MRKTFRLTAAAILAGGALGSSGCQNPNQNDNGSATTAGFHTDIGGGGSTDVYGTEPNSRYRDNGNMGVGFGSGAGAPVPAQSNPPNTNPAPITNAGGEGGATARAPNGGTGGAVTGNNSTTNNGTNTGTNNTGTGGTSGR